jgi:putative ABC transport system permease protein
MAWYHDLHSAIASLFGRREAEQELEEEMRFHLEMETRRHEAAGVSRAEARRRAARDFGGVERYKEVARDEAPAKWLQDIGLDLRYGIRTLVRRPMFTTVAALTLALGIGATTALFSVVKAVLLTPLPYGQPERIAVIWSAWKGFDQTWLSYDEFEAYDAEIPSFENVGLFTDGAVNLIEGGEPERIRAGFVTYDVFSILGVEPTLGRGFTKDEDRPGGPRVIVLGNAVWQRRFGGDPSILGRQIQVGGRPTTVVGIMPAGFKLPLDFGGSGATELWLPLATDAASEGATPGPEFSKGGSNHGYYGVARLREGATTAHANSQIDALIARATRDGIYPEAMQFRAFSVPVEEQVTGRIRPALLVVFGAVGIVLLIACANVAGLMLVRGEARRRELAVRAALGASGRRLTRQLFTESVVLAFFGGALGVTLAFLALRVVRSTAPADLPRFNEARLDLPVLFFALGAAAFAALLAGILPALQASNVAPGNELKEGGRSSTASASRLRWRQALVAAEVALAVVLVSGAGLMIRSVANLFAIDSGINPHNVLTMRLSTPSAYYPDSIKVVAFQDELKRRVLAIPGVTAMGTVRILPLATEMGDWGLRVDGYTPPPNEGTPGDWQVVTPGYFEAMGLRLIKGRFLEERDRMDAPLSMVVNRRFAEKYLAGREAVGGKVAIGGSPDSLSYTIVGVVENVHHNDLTTTVKPQFYAPLAQFARAPGNTTRSANLVIHTSVDPLSITRQVREVIRGLDPRLPVSDIRTMDEVVAASIAAPRFAMGLLGLFGTLALLLSAIGIFGIVSQVVSARSHEFGIRVALGATPRDLMLISLQTGIAQTLVGLAVGVGASLLLTRAMVGLLHGVTPTDPLTFGAVILVTGTVAVLASVGPARRAARIDPMTVLHES